MTKGHTPPLRKARLSGFVPPGDFDVLAPVPSPLRAADMDEALGRLRDIGLAEAHHEEAVRAGWEGVLETGCSPPEFGLCCALSGKKRSHSLLQLRPHQAPPQYTGLVESI